MSNQSSYIVHQHASGELGIFANAFLVETAHGVVAIDATLTNSESRALRARLDALGKPLLAVLITHPHPDHVAGITNLVADAAPVPIVALDSVTSLMHALEAPKRAQWGPMYGEEWVQRWTYPNTQVVDGQALAFDGVSYRVHELGAGGDSDANSIWVIEGEHGAAFIGDLVFDGSHAYVADGHSADWLRNLQQAEDLLAQVDTIYPGHGRPGGLERLHAQRAYLQAYRSEVERLCAGRSALDEEGKRQLTQAMKEVLPGAGLEFLIAHSADAVAGELAALGQT